MPYRYSPEFRRRVLDLLVAGRSVEMSMHRGARPRRRDCHAVRNHQLQ